MKIAYYYLFLFCLLVLSCGPPPLEIDLLIKSGNIIDVVTGKMIEGKAIAINRDTVIAVIDENDLGQYHAKKVVDAKDKFIIPGLWDMHVHFGGGDTLIEENKNLLPLYIVNGITTVRDCAADISPSVLQWRSEIEQGKLFGPSIFTSGPKIEGDKSLWVGDLEVDTKEEATEALDLLQRMKVDFVKVTDNTLKPDLYLTILTEARRRGLKTSAHVPFALTLKQVSASGLGTIEHGSYLLKAGSTREQEITDKLASRKLTNREAMPLILESFDNEKAMAAFSEVSRNGTAVVPTLGISHTLAYLDQDDHHDDEYLDYIGSGLRKTYEGRVIRAAKDDAAAVELRHRVYEKTKSIIPLVQKSGMKIIAGTDAGYLNSFVYPGLALHQELELFTEAGLTPTEALQTATMNGPSFMGKESEFVTIERGKTANLVILNNDPLKNIRNTRDIDAVVLKGKIFGRQSLDSILMEVKRLAGH